MHVLLIVEETKSWILFCRHLNFLNALICLCGGYYLEWRAESPNTEFMACAPSQARHYEVLASALNQNVLPLLEVFKSHLLLISVIQATSS